MARVELVMPKMGESIMEATILKWRKKPGDFVELDEAVLDIATDKVDSEIPSPVAGTLVEILFQENDVVAVNKIIAVIETEASNAQPAAAPAQSQSMPSNGQPLPATAIPYVPVEQPVAVITEDRFYSPLVRTIAKEEGIGRAELDQISGSGAEGRVTKKRYAGIFSRAPAAKYPGSGRTDAGNGQNFAGGFTRHYRSGSQYFR